MAAPPAQPPTGLEDINTEEQAFVQEDVIAIIKEVRALPMCETHSSSVGPSLMISFLLPHTPTGFCLCALPAVVRRRALQSDLHAHESEAVDVKCQWHCPQEKKLWRAIPAALRAAAAISLSSRCHRPAQCIEACMKRLKDLNKPAKYIGTLRPDRLTRARITLADPPSPTHPCPCVQ